jgi:histidine ammonia-lyase
MAEHFAISNEHLGIEGLYDILISKSPISIDPQLLEKVAVNRQFLETMVATESKTIYGINTGFGSLCNTAIPSHELDELQVNLVRSHACGAGQTVDNEIVRLMLFLKAKSLAKGYSGVRIDVIHALIAFCNRGIYPQVFKQGSLGASGDLAPLAHLSLPLLGEGMAAYKNKLYSAQDLLPELGMHPLTLKMKEGLALLNGTQFMLAHLCHCLMHGFMLWHAAHHIAAVSLEAFNGSLDPFHEGIGAVRPHAGQVKSAALMRNILGSSGLGQWPGKAVQDPYSFRCIPQVHGAVYTTLEHCRMVAEVEMNATTDNPIVLHEHGAVLSGGNFHGEELAFALDFLAIALSELANISERRQYLLISGSRGLNPYLSPAPGTRSGYMIPQYTAASIVSQNKQLCAPASVDSIPSSNGQEDHVSMGANAATKCAEVLENVGTVLGIELMLAAQAWEMRKEGPKSVVTTKLVQDFRQVVPQLTEDRVLAPDIRKSKEFVSQHFTPLFG